MMEKEKKRNRSFIFIICLLAAAMVLLGVCSKSLLERIKTSENEREGLEKKIQELQIMQKVGRNYIKDVLRHKAIALCLLELIEENEDKYTRKEKEDLIQLIVMSDMKYGDRELDAPLILSWLEKESGGNPEAVSSAGAKGLTQWMDYRAWKILVEMGYPGYDKKLVFNPVVNLTGGLYHFRKLMNFWEWKGVKGQKKVIIYSLHSYKWGAETTEKLFNTNELNREDIPYVNWILKRRAYWTKKLKYWIDDSGKLAEKWE